MPRSKKRLARPRLDAKGNPASSKPLAEESADLRKLIEASIHKRFGLRGLVGLACIFFALGIWWKWKDVKELPGIEPLIARITEKALPKADPGKFNIAVAHLEGDDKYETERLIRESLAEFPSVATLSFDRLIASEQGDSEKDEREGHERARTLLKASGVDVLIWGVVLKQGGKSLPKLYWTLSRDVAKAPSAGRYQMTEDLRLPSIFWQDLTNVLGLLVVTSEAEFGAQEGQYKADKLDPFILRVRGLLRSSKVEQWNAATRAEVLAILGNALTTYGDQSGRNEPLREAIFFHGEALKEYTREIAPLGWAGTQNNLGTALAVLGERESDPARLKEAVAAFREALKEYTREKVPLGWATTQNNLGNALAALGESDPARLKEAVAAFREALKERTREIVPLEWARTQNNLGIALKALGERESDPARLKEGVAAFREALKEYTREIVPLNWATTQNNLGTALRALGERESDPARLKEAVAAFREALKERTREIVALGERESDPARLKEGVAAFREALKEYTREIVPLNWATTQNNLGTALRALGERESDPARLKEAVAAFREALNEYTREIVPLGWAGTQNNLGTALRALGERESDPARLKEAVAAFREALKEYTREIVPLEWARTQINLGSRSRPWGERESDPARLEEATRALEGALLVLRPAKAGYYVQKIAEENLQRVQKEIGQLKNAKSEVGEKTR